MTGMDGINSLHKMLGALKVNDSTNVNGTAAATRAAENSATAVGSQAKVSTSVDSANLSAAGGLASQATDTSDVRLTKVAELKAAISSGTYNVSSSDVADKMVESMLG